MYFVVNLGFLKTAHLPPPRQPKPILSLSSHLGQEEWVGSFPETQIAYFVGIVQRFISCLNYIFYLDFTPYS